MPSRRHRDWLQAFVRYASYGEAPTSFYWWVGISTIASALRRRVWIDEKFYQWTANQFIILVAPPGIVSKSTTVGIGTSLLKEIPEIHFGPDIVTWPKLIEDMSKVTESVPLINGSAVPHYITMSCLTLHASEFGNLMKPTDEEMTNVLIHMWDGQKGIFQKGTKTSGNDSIENPWINMIACTTPSWIRENFTDAKLEGGFASRCLFLYANQKRQLISYPHRCVPADFDSQREDLIHDLKIIANLLGEMTLSSEAEDWGDLWYANHCNSKHKNLEHAGNLGGYLARKQTHIHKVAMALSAARRDTLEITLQDLQNAAEVVDSLEENFHHIFNYGRTGATQVIAQIEEILSRYPSISRTDLYSQLRKKCTWTEFNEALSSAINAGLAKMENQAGTMTILKIKQKGGYYS